jgi:hypothetical protein
MAELTGESWPNWLPGRLRRSRSRSLVDNRTKYRERKASPQKDTSYGMKELRYASALSIDVFGGAMAARRQIEASANLKHFKTA